MIIPQGVSSKVKDKTNDYILDVENLVVRYETEDGVVNALNGFDLKLKYKQTIGLVGETGAGKTTAALAILRLVPDPPGVVECSKLVLDGHDILALPNLKMDEVRGKDMSMIFQDPMTSLNPVFTVGEQIAESLEIHEGLSKTDAIEKAQEMLELVGIPKERHNEYPHQFSGGMKQRVVIAVALACNPKLLIADEPTTALDVTIQAQVLELMNDLKMKYDTSIIMITHDLGIVAEVCDDVMVMYAGRIVEQGTLEDVFNRTMHPYTEGLFNSLPNIRNRQRMLKPIRGLMPDPMNLPPGCSFVSRCNYANEDCKKAVPELRTVSDTHKVRCIAYDRPGFQIERGRS
ncbi:MAG: ABC transporter ATP-binding protein [Limnochordia bacterium]|nr:ABC transporter ATP-binding protein [Limnochordia bacterium]